MLYFTWFKFTCFLVMVFLLGVLVARFLSHIAWRISNGEYILTGDSKDTYKKDTIPRFHVLGELSLAMLFVLSVLRWEITPKLIVMLSFLCILYLLSFVDISIQEIPDSCHVIAIGIRFLYYFIFEGFQIDSFCSLIASGCSIAILLLLLTLLIEKIWQKEAMGGGDIKLIFVTGLYLGWEKNLLMLFMACILGIAVSLLQDIRDEEGLEEKYFPFGPVLAVSTICCMFFGDGILNWYAFLS